MLNKILNFIIHTIFYLIEYTIKFLKWFAGAIMFVHILPIELFFKRIPKGKRLYAAFHIGVIVYALQLFLSPVLASSPLVFPTSSEWTSEATWEFPSHILAGDWNEYQYYWTDYAWNKYQDEQFMLMLSSENGLFNHDRQSLVVKDGIREDSWGFCQIHRYFHSDTVNDPRFFTDPAWQMDQCYNKFKGGTRFYGYDKIQAGGEFARARKALFNF